MPTKAHSSTIARLLLVAAAAAAAAFASAPALAASRTSASTTICPKLSASAWSIYGRTGTKYALETFGGYPCSNATTWAKKLAAVKLANATQHTHSTIAGPAGFACQASPDRKGHAYTGACRKLDTKTKVVTGFDWTASLL